MTKATKLPVIKIKSGINAGRIAFNHSSNRVKA
jgi:hypothetical protein